jgi:pilus assembly protein CpaE
VKTKQLAAIVSSRNWDDLNGALAAIDSIETLSPIRNPAELKRELSRKLLDVAFIDIDEFDPASNGFSALIRTNGLYVVFVSDCCDTAKMRTAMQAGARDFLARPIRADVLAEVFTRAEKYLSSTADSAAPFTPAADGNGYRDTKIITYFSTKGGAGKSALATNFALALTLKHSDKTVCLLDLDLQFGDLALILNIQPRATIYDLITVGGSISEELPSFITKYNDRLHLLASPVRPEQADLIKSEHVIEIIEALSGVYDYVIIDTAASFSDISMAALDRSHEVFLIITPIILSVKNLKGMLDVMTRSLGYPDEKIKVILNRCDSNSGISGADIEKLCRRKIDFGIPSDGNVVVPSINSGTPAVSAFPKSKFSVAINKMVGAVAGADMPAAAVRAPFWKKLFVRAKTEI